MCFAGLDGRRDRAGPKVIGVRGSIHHGCRSKSEAARLYEDAVDQGKVRRVLE